MDFLSIFSENRPPFGTRNDHRVSRRTYFAGKGSRCRELTLGNWASLDAETIVSYPSLFFPIVSPSATGRSDAVRNGTDHVGDCSREALMGIPAQRSWDATPVPCTVVNCPILDGYTAACNAKDHCEYVHAGQTEAWHAYDVWVWVPPGSFEMGSPNAEDNHGTYESPMHTVTLTSGYFVMKYEVPVLSYAACESALPGTCTPPHGSRGHRR